MGIQGLIPFLKKASRPANIREYKGCTVGIDSYCWLHRGAFACAEKLALGEKTDQYVYYCMKFVNMLLSYEIKPVMVFDGCRLPSKQEVERNRRERRDMNRKKAAQLLREGKRSEARDCLAQCIDITPQMALELMNACREKGVDCIVAPYEADAQLTYLNKIGVAQIIITEDSDLVLFGCEKILFKMDINGSGILVERENLNKALELAPDHYSFDKFRKVCILSGCDYLSNLPGIGLAKALKVFKLSRQSDIRQLIRKIPSTLKMSSLSIPEDYADAFVRAENTFLYQLVYDPVKRKLVPLNDYPDDVDPKELKYAGPCIPEEKALQVALGNINVNTGDVIASFDPDVFKPKTNGWSQNATSHQNSSIWSNNYKTSAVERRSVAPVNDDDRLTTKGMEVVITVPVFKAKTTRVVKKDETEPENDAPSESRLAEIYGIISPTKKSSSSAIMSLGSPPRKRSKVVDTPVLEDVLNLSCHSSDLMETESQESGFTKIVSDDRNMEDSDIRVDEMECSVGKENVIEDKTVEKRHSTGSSPVKRKNVFAVQRSKEDDKKFSLNTNSVTEVKSRFFLASKPRQETSFFKELKKEHSPEISSDVVYECDNEADDTAEGCDDKPVDVDVLKSDESDQVKVEPESMVLESTPIRSKLSNRLSSFKSNFSQQKISDADGNFLLTNAAAKRPFIPVSSASNRGKAFVGNNKLSSKINSPSIDFKKKSENNSFKDDCKDDMLDEDPFLRTESSEVELPIPFQSSSSSSSSIPVKPFSMIKDGSLDNLGHSSETRSDEEEDPTAPECSRLSPRRHSLSVGCAKEYEPESPLPKASSFPGNSSKQTGCRTSGLSKSKGKSKSSSNCAPKQSAISSFFQSAFALKKKSVEKLQKC